MIKNSGLKKLQGNILKIQGTPLLSNFSWKYGEIDLIMKDKDTIVFVEVRSLTKEDNIHPSETITKKQSKKIKKQQNFFFIKINFMKPSAVLISFPFRVPLKTILLSILKMPFN